ncbi:MAG: nucleotidyltransferase [Rhodococcus sp. (in: high G+C Gram-positive bacteria)]|uniref:SMODS domain-containing nucleotidyltransferase n=1 Tax=Rhodococcus sp. I2R TaxID=2855445 RepID=UPI001E4AFAE9|nr:nucleotidyltransferase [Rhodococcus sp. I2R]MCC8927324.1 nucleotidyltransferase [Rhodococcus sp. I2R]
MKLTDYFNVLLKDTVNLGQVKLDSLDSRVETVYKALKADEQIGHLILGKTPQGSWAHKTIINPVGSNEFDADFMLDMSENADWSDDPKKYIEEVYAALHRHSTYSNMPHSRKCRCVRLVYANSMHLDIVPHLNLADGREVIVNRDDNAWESTDPQGFTDWMKNKDALAKGNLRKVIRLMKYLRDHKNSFTGTRSILLTTLLGEQVTELRALLGPGYYSDVPTTLLHLVKDLDAWLEARPIKPSIPDPAGSGVTFDHRWEQATYSYFRDRIHVHAAEIEEAYEEENKERSIELWQGIFGDRFKAPATSSNSAKFPAAAPAAASTVGRSGRAG